MTFGGGYGGGGFGQPPSYDMEQFRREIGQLRQEFGQHVQGIAGLARGADKRAAEAMARLDNLAKGLDALSAKRYAAGAITWEKGPVRVEDIPGRRVPYVLLVDIPIGANTTSVQQGSVTISQEGPFVAVKRMATFMSALEFQVTTTDESQNTATARFSGRSFGRYRPIHSASDFEDAQSNTTTEAGSMFLFLAAITAVDAVSGGVMPAFTSTASPFRTMEFDGRIAVINAGSSYPRQNITVPTSMWSPDITAPQELGALDFFERGEVLQFEITPNHVNNPAAGNAQGLEFWAPLAVPVGASTAWPFLAGQYDPHEGIATTGAIDFDGGSGHVVVTSDPVQRLPDGIMTLGWEGYRIIQPIAP